MIDVATKQKSGIDYEVMEEIGKITHLKIDWVEETGYGSYPEQLSSGKEDALCTTLWASVARATRVLYTVPVQYSPLYLFARKDDTRFDGGLNLVNSEKTTVAIIDGSTMQAIVDSSFPKAKRFAVPASSEDGTVMMNVATRKADVAFLDEVMAGDYNKRNPQNMLRKVAGVTAIRTYPEPFSVAMNEWELREILNAAINELHNNGTIDRLISKYENTPGEIMRVPLPYAAVVKE
jgi:ABC-type amino acid transport substrate-binding protein